MLYDLTIQENNGMISKEDIKKILADFSCPLNDDVEDFMRNKAYDFDRTGISRTYLIYAIVNKVPHLCGIYSLTPGVIELDERLSKNERKKILGTTYPIGKKVKTYLIGQLSKNYKDNNNRFITGEILLELAFDRIRKNNKTLPSTVVHIDCKDIDYLNHFYERFGFEYFHTNSSGLRVYLTPTKKIMNAEYKQRNQKEKREVTAG
ncbi:MAG: hypothetical protein RR444_09720 [Oscillospiraceae bacterium]